MRALALVLFLLHGGVAFLLYLLLPKRALPEAHWLCLLAPLAFWPFRMGFLSLRDEENPHRRPLALGFFGAGFFYLAVLGSLLEALGEEGGWLWGIGAVGFILGLFYIERRT
ncbi:MAG: hypothetical protein ACUVS9_02610 [Thermaceae bacterium]